MSSIMTWAGQSKTFIHPFIHPLVHSFARSLVYLISSDHLYNAIAVSLGPISDSLDHLCQNSLSLRLV